MVRARFQLPDGLHTTTISMIDLRADFARIDGAGGGTTAAVDPAHRLGTEMLTRFFGAAWHAGVNVLPLAATRDPRQERVAGPASIECHLAANGPRPRDKIA